MKTHKMEKWLVLVTFACVASVACDAFSIIIPNRHPPRWHFPRSSTARCRNREPIVRMSKDDGRNTLAHSDPRSLQWKKTIEAGDTVVCQRDIESSGIFANQGYELQSIYAQRFNTDKNQVEKVALSNMEEPVPAGYDRFITLYSPVHHDEPVVVTPEEVGLLSIRNQLVNAMWLAVPGVFWVFVANAFYNIFHERTGGSFLDALLGRY